MYFASYCNNKAHEIRVLGVTLCFSYDTLIGVFYNGEGKRRSNEWGPTTGKHINAMGLKQYKEVTETELEEFMQQSIRDAALQSLADKLTQ